MSFTSTMMKTSPVKKKMKPCPHKERNDAVTGLLSLDDDCLRAVLIRARASDHLNLKLSCRRICEILDSRAYAKERSDQGYAEVKVKLLSLAERYKDVFSPPLDQISEEFKSQFSIHEFTSSDYFIQMSVDGVQLSHFEYFKYRIILYPRKWHDYGELSELFTNRGKPKVACLKNAEDQHYRDLPILYISDLELPLEYRSMTSTVGPLIIKGLLNAFRGKYAFAIYIPCSITQMTDEEEILDMERSCRDDPWTLDDQSDEVILKAEKKKERRRSLEIQDMRQFLRIGFSQIKDNSIVQNITYYYVFATPNMVETHPILSEEETLQIPIKRRPLPPPVRTGLAKKLFVCVQNECEANWKPREGMFIHAPLRQQRTTVTAILNKCSSDESRLKLILESDAMNCCAAHHNLSTIIILLESLSQESRQTALNRQNYAGISPLTIAAEMASEFNLAGSRRFIESLMSHGADKNIVDFDGLSALGNFIRAEKRRIVKIERNGDYTRLYRDIDANRDREVELLKGILRPNQGMTDADLALTCQSDEEDSEDDDDSSNFYH